VPQGTALVREALAGAVDALGAAGVDSPRLDAELLLAEATGWPRERFATDPDDSLPSGASREFAQMVRRRIRREPVAEATFLSTMMVSNDRRAFSKYLPRAPRVKS
jgi:release factor glutamine methyltransferase